MNTVEYAVKTWIEQWCQDFLNKSQDTQEFLTRLAIRDYMNNVRMIQISILKY